MATFSCHVETRSVSEVRDPRLRFGLPFQAKPHSNIHMNNENQNPDDQDFDVFRYVAEEMTADEELRFEERLGHDQKLREQVANMVSTMATVDNVFANAKVSPADSNRAARLRVRRIVVSVAALVLFATLAITLMPQPDMPESNTESVAIAWAEALDSEEFELPEPEDDFEFAAIEFESDDDWIVDVVNAAIEASSSLN